MDELEERVFKFNSLSLPGQPMAMHMGTSYLVNDLWREVQRLRGLTPRAADVCQTCGDTGRGRPTLGEPDGEECPDCTRR